MDEPELPTQKELMETYRKNRKLGIMPVQASDHTTMNQPIIGFDCKCCGDNQVVQYHTKDSLGICDSCLQFIGKLRKRSEGLG